MLKNFRIFTCLFVSLSLTKQCKAAFVDKEKQVSDELTVETLDCQKIVENLNDSREKNTLQCSFPEFKIAVSNVPTMQNKKFILDVYKWFKKNVFYSHEINSLTAIYFDGTVQTNTLYGSYSPYNKIVSLFPNSTALSLDNVSPKVLARFEPDDINPKKGYKFWQYTISHEYSHHQTFTYGSTWELNEYSWGGERFHDFKINKQAQELLEIANLAKRKEFKDKNKVGVIPRFSAFPEIGWPSNFIGSTQNKYLWTNAELLARHFQLYTYKVPEELHNENSVNTLSNISDDYWWMHYYGSNVYEQNKDKDKKPIQKPVDEFLEKWSKHIDDEFFNDDATFGEIFNDAKNNIYITGHKKMMLKNTKTGEKIEFSKLKHQTNALYSWRPFDNRKNREIIVESNVYKSDKPLENGIWDLMSSNKRVKDAFDLQEGQKQILKTPKGKLIVIEAKKEGIVITKGIKPKL